MVTQKHRLTSKGIKAIPDIFTSYYYEDEMGYKYEYRPVTLTSFAIEHQFFGEKPAVSHFINLLLYFFCCWTFVLVLKQLFSGLNELFVIVPALIFAVHPLHTEVVASIKNRDEILTLLFALLAFYQSILFFNKGKLWTAILIAVFLILGLLSKSSSASYMIVIPLASVLVPNVDFKKTGILLLSVSAALLVFLVLKEYPIIWFFYIMLAITALVAVVVFFRNPEYRTKAIQFMKPVAVSENTVLLKSSFSEINLSDILLYLFVIALCAIAYLKNNFSLLLLPLLFLLFSNLWTKKYRFDFIILTIIIVAFTTYFHYSIYSLLFLFAYVMLIRDRVESSSYKWLIPLVLITVVVYLKAYLNASIGDANIILAYGLIYLAQKYFKWRYTQFLLWTIALILHIYFAYKYYEEPLLKDFFLVVLFFGLATSALQISEKFKRYVSFVFSILIIFSFSADIITKNQIDVYVVKVRNIKPAASEIKPLISNQDPDKSKTTDKQNIKGFAIVNKEDRPLDFVEFPLGFSPTLSEKAGTVSTVLGHYLKAMFLPFKMSFYYGYSEVDVVDISNPKAIFYVIVYLLILISGIYFIRSHPLYSLGVFIYLSSIFLFSNLIAPVAGMIGDRLTFTASIGFAIAIGYPLAMLLSNSNAIAKKILSAGLAIIFLSFSVQTIARNTQWKDHLTLYRHDIKHLDKSAQAHNLLATRLVFESNKSKNTEEQEKLRREAVTYYKDALNIYPSFFNAQYDLARTYGLLRDAENAIREYEKTIALDSLFPYPYMQIALIYEALNQPQKSIKYYEGFLKISPNDLQAYINYSTLQFTLGNLTKAIEINLKAVELFPGAYDPVVNIGKTYFTMGDKRNALIYFERAYLINQSDKNLPLTISKIYGEMGNREKAEYYFSKANSIKH
jgi:tetratricopeptide (TPR) repeat protein